MERKKLFYFLRIVLSLVILFLIFRKIDLASTLATFSRFPFYLIIFLLLTAALKTWTQLINWLGYLRLTNAGELNRREAAKAFFIGLALRFTIPGGHGTFGKVFFIGNSKKKTALSVVAEKFFQGWAALFTAVTAGIFYFPRPYNNMCRGGVVILILVIVLLPLIKRLVRKQETTVEITLKKVGLIVCYQLLFIGITCLQYYLVIKSLQAIAFKAALTATPLILSANMIPFTISGLGFRELFAVQVLAHYQIAPATAVATSLGVFLTNSVLPALPGVYFLLNHKGTVEKKLQ